MRLFQCVLVGLLTLIDGAPLSSRSVQYECTGLYISQILVNNEATLALLDTGCQICFLDTVFFEQHLAGNVSPAGQERIELSSGKSVTALVFDVPLQLESGVSSDVQSSIVDLETIATAVGIDFKAVVGMSYFDDHPMRFNGSDGSVVQLLDDEMLPKIPAIALRTRSTRPLVQVSLPLIGVRDFLIDTGMTGAIALEQSRLAHLERGGFAVKLPEQGREVYSADGTRSQVEAYWLKRIDINGQRFENLSAQTAKESIIGMAILRHFDLTIDCEGKRLWMDPFPSADLASFAPGGTGFHFKFDSSRRLFVEQNMRLNGPAELVGIKPGDEIIEIDGDAVDDYTFFSVTDRFSQAGTNLHLRCRRDGKDFEVDLVLKHRYQYPPEWPPERAEFNPDAVPEK